MEVKDPGNKIGRKEKDVLVTLPPFAIFIVNPRLPNPGDDITFNASASLNGLGNTGGLEYRWQWDNLETWEGPVTNPIIHHTYAVAAIKKTITLEVRDQVTGQVSLATVEMSIKRAIASENAPFAAFNITPNTGRVLVNNSLSVDASICADREDTLQNLKLMWDWGDGVKQTDFQLFDQRKNLSHPYLNPGKYTIRLQTQDTNGNISQATLQIFVQP